MTAIDNNITIRGERPGDEDAIAAVVCRAFRSCEEVNLIEIIRKTMPTFDRRLSIGAWHGDEMVGHVLLTPANIYLHRRTAAALAVAPVAVRPDHQRQGVGRAMLEFAHERGRRQGFALAFLNGIPSYYPKLGYRACFGFAGVDIDVEKLPEPSEQLTPWPVRPADVPWLGGRFAAEWTDVDFTWQRGGALAEWTLPGSDAIIWRAEDGRRAYTVRGPGQKGLNMLLADDAQVARDAIATVKPPSLEHHPSGWLAREALDPTWSSAHAKRDGAAMAIELQPGVLEPVISALETGARPPGFCNWPMPFRFC